MSLKREIKDGEQEISMFACGCSDNCGSLKIAVRNADIQPNPERPDELLCTFSVPMHAIIGMTTAMLKHFDEVVKADL